jgi:hypothetical protein
MKYKVVNEYSLRALQDAVEFFFLEEGWVTQGGVVFDGKKYLQTVTKEVVK